MLALVVSLGFVAGLGSCAISPSGLVKGPRMFIETSVVAAQGASEAVGTAATGAMLAGSAPALGAVMPMGGEEVSATFAQAIAAHAAQYLAATGLGVAQRELFAAQVANSAGVYAASDALSQAALTV